MRLSTAEESAANTDRDMNISRRKFIRETALGTVALAVPFISSCNENASAQSEIATTIPNPPTNLLTYESLRYITLTWSAPLTDTDGSGLSDLQSFQIWRRLLPSPEFMLIREIDKSVMIFIDATTGEKEAQYQVVAKTGRGAVSSFSEASVSSRAQLKISASEILDVGELAFYASSGTRTLEPSAALIGIERTSQQDFFALELICTHAGCGGMNFENKTWTCRCHGSQFDKYGRVLNPPAQSPLISLRSYLQESGELWVRTV